MRQLLLFITLLFAPLAHANFSYEVSEVELDGWWILRSKIDDYGTIAATASKFVTYVNPDNGLEYTSAKQSLSVVPGGDLYSILEEGKVSSKWLCDINLAGEVLFGDQKGYTKWYPSNAWKEFPFEETEEEQSRWPIGLLEDGTTVYAYRGEKLLGLTLYENGEELEDISLIKAFKSLGFPTGTGLIPQRVTDNGIVLCIIVHKDKSTFNLYDIDEARFRLPGGFPENEVHCHLIPIGINAEESVLLATEGLASSQIYCWCPGVGYHLLLPVEETEQGSDAQAFALSDGDYFVGEFWDKSNAKERRPFIADLIDGAWIINDCLIEESAAIWSVTHAMAVNSMGQIIARATLLEDETQHTVLLNPI